MVKSVGSVYREERDDLCDSLEAECGQFPVHLTNRARSAADQAHTVIQDGSLDAIQGSQLGPEGQSGTGHAEDSACWHVFIQSGGHSAQQAWHTEQSAQTRLGVIQTLEDA
jgi:hypothetical protein